MNKPDLLTIMTTFSSLASNNGADAGDNRACLVITSIRPIITGEFQGDALFVVLTRHSERHVILTRNDEEVLTFLMKTSPRPTAQTLTVNRSNLTAPHPIRMN